MSFWMIPSSENNPTQVMIMAPDPCLTEVPDSSHGFSSSDFSMSCDSPVSADSSHWMLLQRYYKHDRVNEA